MSSLRSSGPTRQNSPGWIGLQVVFWGATTVFFVLYFGREAESYLQSLLFVGLLLPVAMATTYFVAGFLVPRFLLTERYALFAIYGIYTLIASVYLELGVLVASFIFLAGYQMSAMNPAALDVFGLVVASNAVVFMAVAADLAMRWHRLRVEHEEAERGRLQAELELRQAELARLKTQMQPHFLFNTLNNLYGLTLEGSDEAPDVVLRISAMLDYVLYGCRRALVSLRGEVEHLKTYLELESLRYDDRLELRFSTEGDLPEACIAPLLLTPFVENSFKHGVARTTGKTWVSIRLRIEGEMLHFRVENQKAGRVDTNGTKQLSGIGLENVRRRLRLLYPETHLLEIDDGRERYAVHLRIPIHPIATMTEPAGAT